MTRDIPILFSAPMVRAIMEGRKTQTRRAIPGVDGDEYPYVGSWHEDARGGYVVFQDYPRDQAICRIQARIRWQPGDRLWVKETWALGDLEAIYRADDPECDVYRWYPSIHMPRWASRITLLVTDVRVQRLQDISEEDARAEGAPPWTGAHQSYVTGFYNIWATINGPGSWDANPWVAAISFERVTP